LLAAYASPDDSVGFTVMEAILKKFHDVARWAVVNTTASGLGHPEPRKRHRRGSKLAYLHIRVMLAELVRWRRQAKRFGLSLSEYVRAKMNNGKVRVVMVTDPALLAEYKRHNNNLNQVLHLWHSSYPVAPTVVIAAISDLHKLYRRDLERG
jgi:Ni,Fe-hydrogenase maturation factor